ncbi:MAG: hypothetical protein WCG45_04680, partial [bacterium]
FKLNENLNFGSQPGGYFPPDGPPPNYIFPKYWGEKTKNEIKMLCVDEKTNLESLSYMEILGYPPNFKV